MTDRKLTAASIQTGSINREELRSSEEPPRWARITLWAIICLIPLGIFAGGAWAGKAMFSTHTTELVEVVTSVPSVCERALKSAERSHQSAWEAEQQQKAAQLATNDYQDAWSKGDTKRMAKLLDEGNTAGLARDTADLQAIGHWNDFMEHAQGCRQEMHKAPTRETSLTSRD